MIKSKEIYPDIKQAIILTILWIVLHALVYLLGSFLIHVLDLNFSLFTAITYFLASFVAIPIIMFSRLNILKYESFFFNRAELIIPDIYVIGKLLLWSLLLILADFILTSPVQFMELIVNGKTEIVRFMRVELTLPIVFHWIHRVILAPIFEELFFRGILLTQFAKRYSLLFAIFFSSLLFTAAHFSFDGILGLFFVGLILAYIYLNTKSIICTMIVHSLINAFYFHFSLRVCELNFLTALQPLASLISLGLLLYIIIRNISKHRIEKLTVKITRRNEST